MGGLFWLLLFAGLFYFMMRHGCGAHVVHGGHGGHGEHEGHAGHGAPGGAVRDPVCGMDVAVGQGYAKMDAGRELRFCSRRCLDQFDADPGRYLGQKGA